MIPDYVDLYVCPDIRAFLSNKVQELARVNHRLYLNKLLYIVSRLHWKQIHHPKNFKNKGAKLRTHVNAGLRQRDPEAEKGTLVWLLSSKGGKVTNMIDTLVQWGVIEMKSDYIIGVSSRTYTFTEVFANKSVVLERFYADKDGAFVQKELERRFSREQHPLVQKIIQIYSGNVSLSEEGLQYIQDQYGHNPAINHIADAHRKGCFEDNREELLRAICGYQFAPKMEILMKLFRGEYYASVGAKNGRVDHNLTNLSRDYRKFLHLDGKPLLETDIVNCQPALAAGLIKAHLKKMHGEHFEAADMSDYEQYCAKGQFYEVVAAKAGIHFDTPDARDEFKKKHLYPEVFYCKNNNWNTPTQLAFKALFPNAAAAIHDLKKVDHKSFSIALQRLESDVVVHTVFNRLVEEGHKVLPLHDAIYTNNLATKQYAQELIREKLQQSYGIDVAFKEEVPHNQPKYEPSTYEAPQARLEAAILKEQAYTYFTNRIDRFILLLEAQQRIDYFQHQIVCEFVQNQWCTDDRITVDQRAQLEDYFVEFDQEILRSSVWPIQNGY